MQSAIKVVKGIKLTTNEFVLIPDLSG